MNFYSITPYLTNVDLIKGQTPYYLAKECGYDCVYVSFSNDNYTYLNTFKELKVDFFKGKFSDNLLDKIKIMFYIIKNAKNIDILNCAHYKRITIIYFILYKMLNHNGIAYFQFDMIPDSYLFFTCKDKSIRCIARTKKLLFIFKHLIDLAIIENRESFNIFVKYNPLYKEKTFYLPWHIDLNHSIEKKKKNQIISVARIGTKQKASEIILESFKEAIKKSKDKKWVLKMVGPINEDFKEYIEKFFYENPELKDNIQFTGDIVNRDELFELYSESKIFCLPSRWESFGIAFAEALFYSNYLIISDVGIAKQLIDMSNFGKLVEIDNVEDISNKLVTAMENYDDYYIKNEINFKKLVSDEFSHENYIKDLDLKLKEIKNNK